MRKITLIVASIVLLGSLSYSQNSNYVRKFPDRYELDLPKEWDKPKLIMAITEILPKTLDVLKDKDFCTGCKAGYSIKLTIDPPYIKSRNNISKGIENSTSSPRNYNSHYSMEVVYQFRAALELYDSAGKNIIDLVLVLPEEEHIKKKDTSMYNLDYSRPQTIKDMYGGTVATVQIPAVNSIPITNTLYPSLYEQLAIAEQRVYAIQNILKKN
jgi:hypothetical protein